MLRQDSRRAADDWKTAFQSESNWIVDSCQEVACGEPEEFAGGPGFGRRCWADAAAGRIGLGGVIVDEETGLRFHRARWAEAETNQFLSEDPILSGPNRRIYGANSPQRYTDPWGLLPVDPPPGGVRAISHIFYVKFSQWIQPDSTSCRKF
jgi:RHS repeat-associated protein